MRVLSTVTDAINIPCGSTASIVEHHLVEIILSGIVHTLVGFHWIFRTFGRTPHPSDEILTEKLAPIVLYEIVGVTIILMQQIFISRRHVFTIIAIAEQGCREDVERLPLCTTFPPCTTTVTIIAKAPTPTIIPLRRIFCDCIVGTHQKLEHMSNLMRCRMSAFSTCRPRVAMEKSHLVGLAPLGRAIVVPNSAILSRTVSTPFGLIDNEHADFMVIGQRIAWLQETQFFHVTLPNLFTVVEERLHIDRRTAQGESVVPQGQTFLPETHKMFRFHRTLEAPSRSLFREINV